MMGPNTDNGIADIGGGGSSTAYGTISAGNDCAGSTRAGTVKRPKFGNGP